jgi:hypothetical protein
MFAYCNQFDSRYLPDQEADTRSLMNQMIAMGQNSALNMIRLHLQAIHNFLGRTTDEPKYFKGEILDYSVELTAENKEKEPLYYRWILFYCMMVAYCFGDYDLAASFSIGITKLRQDRIAVQAIAAGAIIFYESIALLASMRGRRKLPYVRRNLRKLEYFAKHAPMNFLGKVHLLKAELSVVSGDHLSVHAEYISAILFSREAGFVMQEAMANERAGRYYLSRNEEEKGEVYIQEALRVYEIWGGIAKVQHLQTEFPRFFFSNRSDT